MCVYTFGLFIVVHIRTHTTNAQLKIIESMRHDRASRARTNRKWTEDRESKSLGAIALDCYLHKKNWYAKHGPTKAHGQQRMWRQKKQKKNQTQRWHSVAYIDKLIYSHLNCTYRMHNHEIDGTYFTWTR